MRILWISAYCQTDPSDPCPVQAVGESGGRGLVDDSHDLEAGSVAGLDRRLALGIAEIGGDRDHGAIDGLPQGKLGIGLEPLQLCKFLFGNTRRDIRHPVLSHPFPIDNF